MLPTKGYFQDIECPYYNSFCGRPYCHFRHRKKPSETIEEPVEVAEKNAIPTYKPTPKSQLESLQTNKSHIPISYVPDLTFRHERQIRPIPRYEKPTYNPTPLSLLLNEGSTTGQSDEKKISIINKEYDPLKSEINFEDLTTEFDLIDEIINEDEVQAKFSDDNESDSEGNKKASSVKNSADLSISKTKKSSDSNINKTEKSSISDKESRAKITEKVSSSDKESRAKSTKKHSSSDKESRAKTTEKHSDSDKESRVKTTEKHSCSDKESQVKTTEKHSDSEKESSSGLSKKQSNKTEPKKESKDKKKDKVIPSSSSDSELKKDNKNKSVPTKSSKKHSEKSIESSSDSDVKKDKKSSHRPNEKCLEKTEKRDKSSSSGKRADEKKDKNSDSEQSEKERSSDKNRKHSSLKEKGSEKSSTKEKSGKNKEKDKKGESSEKHSSSTSKRKRDKSEEKSDDKEKHNHTKNKKKDKHDKEEDKSTKKKHKNKERDKEKEKSKDKDKQSIEKERKKSSKDRDKKNDTSKKHEKSDEKDKRDRDKKHKKTSSKKPEKKRKSSTTSISSHSSSLGNFENNFDDIRNVEIDNLNNFEPEISDIDLDDEDETMRECLKIFNEYKPKPVASVPESRTMQQGSEFKDNFSDIMNSKKRTAHDGAEISHLYSKVQPPPKVKTILTPGEALRNRLKVARQAQKAREDDNVMSEIEKIVHTPQQNAKRSAPTSLLEAARQLKIKRTERAVDRQPIARAASIVDDILNGTASSNAGFVPRKKISAAPNVALIQKAKERISRIVSRPPEPIKTVAHNQKTSRVAHVPEYSLSDIPDVLQAAKSKLPVNVRTRFLTMIADECVKLYLSRDDAYGRALNEEFACYEKCKVLATYRNSAMLAVNRLRKEIQERVSKGLGLMFAGENTDADKSNDFEGRKFYNNVARWVLTEEELKLHGYPREAGDRGRVVINDKKEKDYSLDANYRRCSRCHKVYQVDDDGWPLYDEECMYHPLKKRTIRGEQVFLCCKSTDDSGCVTSDTHVSDGLDHEQLNGYQTTLPPETDGDPRSYSVYALDCEMCYTTKGLELTRVTIVDTDCKTVYESLVKPMNPIIDYNTRFSGITADQMNKTSTSILQVQANILHLCNAKTILVGHSLESDMKALKIVHGTVIDTSVLFPHKMGLPHKRALRALASEYLKKIIQDDVNGHDSAEDAVTCMELVKWKLKEELKVRIK